MPLLDHLRFNAILVMIEIEKGFTKGFQMRMFKAWANARPLATAFLFLLVAALYFLAPIVSVDPSQLFGNGERDVGAESFAQVLWPEIRLAAAILIAVVLIGWVRRTRLATWPRWSTLLLTVPFIAFCIFVIISPILVSESGAADVTLTQADWQSIWMACLVAILVGFFEELLFRGVVLQALLTRMNGGLAVIIAAIIFGLFHYVNWVSGQPLGVTTMQVLGAMAIGLLFGAFVLWTGSIWPSIFLHGLWDSSVSVSQTLQANVSPTGDVAEVIFDPWSALASPPMIYGVLLLVLWVFFDRRKRKATSV
ncbi:CPBP family intramembrane glutamic endopeptidase [Yoonia sp. 208BN28-4]|uniref:CPBP family intramembrane glutamic endopeptidase n=1 Tax=Yoonia sp. 208BN28-4 TaxID=3126505 RepID=UPI003097F055